MLTLEFDKTTHSKLQGQLSTVRRSVRTKAVRSAIREVVKFGVDDVKATLRPRMVTGATRKSIKSLVSTSKRGSVTGRIGQQRTKTYKVAKKVLKRDGLSPIQRAGQPTPLHWIDLGTKPHDIRASGNKRLRFTIGGRTISVKSVRHPGARANAVLAPTHRKIKRLAPLVFKRVVRDTVRAST